MLANCRNKVQELTLGQPNSRRALTSPRSLSSISIDIVLALTSNSVIIGIA